MLDTTRRTPDYLLLTVVGILVPIGLVMVYSASFMDALVYHDGNPLYYAWRQFTAAIIGTVALLVTQRIDYRFWKKYALHLMALALFLMALTIVLPTGFTTVNGARSWLRLGPLSFQPSEFAKLALIIYFASWLSRRSEKLGNVTYGLVPFAVVLGLVCGMVMLQRDLGTTMVIIMIGVVVYFAAGANTLHLVGAGLVSGAAFWGMVQVASYRQERIQVWLEGPFAHYDGAGYQPAHALYALASGGLFGSGLGLGRQKFLWLPQAHTDAIFAIIGEEFGLIGTIFIVICFLVIGYRGFRIAARAPEPFAALMATGLTAWLVFQAFINIAVVTTLIPFTGLTLPFLSYGGSSLIMTMIAAGMLLNLSRHMVEHETGEVFDVAKPSRDRASIADTLSGWWRDGRARLSGAGSRRGARRAAPAALPSWRNSVSERAGGLRDRRQRFRWRR
jgi:cell division protein FtsW